MYVVLFYESCERSLYVLTDMKDDYVIGTFLFCFADIVVVNYTFSKQYTFFKGFVPNLIIVTSIQVMITLVCLHYHNTRCNLGLLLKEFHQWVFMFGAKFDHYNEHSNC